MEISKMKADSARKGEWEIEKAKETSRTVEGEGFLFTMRGHTLENVNSRRKAYATRGSTGEHHAKGERGTERLNSRVDKET